MEKRYHELEAERFVSGVVNLDDYFNDFGKFLSEVFPDQSKGVAQHAGMSAAEARYMDVCTNNLFPPSRKNNEYLILDGFAFDTEEIPDAATSLKSLMFVKRRSKSNKAVKALKRKLFYPGEVDVEDAILEDKDKFQNRVDLVPFGFYVVSVRVHLPVLHIQYTESVRARDIQVSQEFLCLSSTGLDTLRDRIACSGDYQPVDGDISDDLSRKTSSRTGDIHRSAMFYLGNDFYIDRRRSDNMDYSAPIMKWGLKEGYEFGSVIRMENTTIADLKSIRLGYPYLYLHQGTCEHLIIFNDARLLHPRDPMDSTKFPFLMGFGSFNSRYCFACHTRMARYLVVESDRLPEDVAYMCTACLESFNYKGGQKIGHFKVLGYVDRAALL